MHVFTLQLLFALVLRSSMCLSGRLSHSTHLSLVPIQTNASDFASASTNQVVSTLAGSGHAGYKDSGGLSAQLNMPSSVVIVKNGTAVIFSDKGNNRIREYSFTTGGVITLCGGTNGYVNGYCNFAQLNQPSGVALDRSGRYLIIADTGNHCIRQIDLDNHLLSTIAGRNHRGYVNAIGLSARFSNPYGVVYSPDGRHIYISDFNNHAIRQLDMVDRAVTTIAGRGVEGYVDEVGTLAQFHNPAGLALHSAGQYLLVIDRGNHRLRKVDLAISHVSSFCGSGESGFGTGSCSVTKFNFPHEVMILTDGSRVVVSDTENNYLVNIDLTTYTSSVLAGTRAAGSRDGHSSVATFLSPRGVAEGLAGELIIADTGNNKIRMIAAAAYTSSPTAAPTESARGVSTIAGNGAKGPFDGFGTGAAFSDPVGVAMHPSNQYMFITDTGNHKIRKCICASGQVITVAGAGSPSFTDAVGLLARFNFPRGVAFVLVLEGALITDSLNHRIRLINLITFEVTTYAGNGVAATVNGATTSASFNFPYGIAVAADETYALTTEYDGNVIRQIVFSSGTVTTLVGSGIAGLRNGVGTAVMFSNPTGVAISPDNSYILVTDKGNNMIRRIILESGEVSTYCGMSYSGYREGSCAYALLSSPHSIVISNGRAFISDMENNRVRSIDFTSGVVALLAGSHDAGYLDGPLHAAQFRGVRGLTVSTDGDMLYVLDTENQFVRAVDIVPPRGPSSSPTVAPTFTPTIYPTTLPTHAPTIQPTSSPSLTPTPLPSSSPTPAPTTNYFNVEVLVGNKVSGFRDGSVCKGKLNTPGGLARLSDDSILIADTNNHILRRLYSDSLTITTVAGCFSADYADGQGTSACLNAPHDIAVHPMGQYALVTESSNFHIRMLMLSDYMMSTPLENVEADIQHGIKSDEFTHYPIGIAIDSLGKFAYLTMYYANVIRRVNLIEWRLTTIAGSGHCGSNNAQGVLATFCYPQSIAISPSGNFAAVADYMNNKVRLIDLSTMMVSDLCFVDSMGHVDESCPQSVKSAVFVDDSHVVSVGEQGMHRIDVISGLATSLATSISIEGAKSVLYISRDDAYVISTKNSIYRIFKSVATIPNTQNRCSNSDSGDTSASRWMNKNAGATSGIAIVVLIVLVIGVRQLLLRHNCENRVKRIPNDVL